MGTIDLSGGLLDKIREKHRIYQENEGDRVEVVENGRSKSYHLTGSIASYVHFILDTDIFNSKKAKQEENHQPQRPKNNFPQFGNSGSGQGRMPDIEKPKGPEKPEEEKDEYIPQDYEFGESMGEESHIFEISPGREGYFCSGRKSYFTKGYNIWSKKKKLEAFSKQIDRTKTRYAFRGLSREGLFAIPLPQGAYPDPESIKTESGHKLHFKIDQYNCIYLESAVAEAISFDFYTDQWENTNQPIKEDSEKIIDCPLTSETEEFMKNLSGSDLEKAMKIREYIISNKKYPEKISKQETLRTLDPANFFMILDQEKELDCYNSNTLFVGLCRKAGIPARLCRGHFLQGRLKNGDTYISSNNGHAWSEVWNNDLSRWEMIDSTPEKEAKKDDGKEGNGGEKKESPGSGNEESQKEDGEGKGGGKGEGAGSGSGEGERQPGKNEGESLEDLIKRIEEDHMKQSEKKLEKMLKDISRNGDKDIIKKISEKGQEELKLKVKEKLREKAEEKILDIEKEDLDKLKDERDVERYLDNSILDPEYKERLKYFAEKIKERIRQEKELKKVKMESMGFTKEEEMMYDLYMELEEEVRSGSDIRKNIRVLEELLPKEYRIEMEGHYHSGSQIDDEKLVEWKVSKDDRVFLRENHEVQDIIVRMFEIIIIDRSGSMGNIRVKGSPIRETVKAAIIRAKSLEHFMVDFSILIFDTELEEVMSFGEKFGDRRTKIASRLMRSLLKSGGTDVSKPMVYSQAQLEKQKKRYPNYIGNISFFGDGQPQSGIVGEQLKNIIGNIKKRFSVTAYYVNGSDQNKQELDYYFGEDSVIVIPDVKELSSKVIGNFNKNIRRLLNKLTS